MPVPAIDLTRYSNQFSSYTELRLHENRTQLITLLNGDVVSNSRDTTSGVSARVFDKGAWGFSSSPDFANESIEATIAAATTNAAFLSRKTGKADAVLPHATASLNSDFTTKKTPATQEEKIAFLRRVDDYIVKNCPDIISRRVGLNCLDMEKSLHTSEGSSGININTRAVAVVQLTTKSSTGQPIEVMQPVGHRGQFEDAFPTTEEMEREIDKLYKQLMDKKSAVRPVSGYHDVILASDLAGILAHEAIGHTTEADLVRAGSVAGDYLGQQVASELVTMVDFAHTYNGETLPIPVYLDDEGVESTDTVLIEKGILKAFMNNKETAQHFGTPLTGNARAYAYSDEPLVRMRNTAILPGTSKFEEMIASIEHGYLLTKPTNGQADSTSEFMFGVQMGYEIENGKLGRAITDTTISGVAFDMLKEVTMLSDEMVWSCSGMCGKKQWIPVGMGGPAVKTKVFIGGE